VNAVGLPPRRATRACIVAIIPKKFDKIRLENLANVVQRCWDPWLYGVRRAR